MWIAGWYTVVSLLTFAVYAIDKSAARRGTWRTAERTLHWLALVGGWPGALLAQQWLRHKSSKPKFRVVFWITVALNVVGVVLICAFIGDLLSKR
jgi:uncharacterized membrane protein YsdA (DUF1294 family)